MATDVATDAAENQKAGAVTDGSPLRPEDITPETARAIYRQGEEAVVQVLCALAAAVMRLEQETVQLRRRIEELEGQLAKNSHNSHKPPGSDGPGEVRRTQSERVRSGKKAGGQQGHGGTTLKLVANPDRIVRHGVTHCATCRHSLEDVAPTAIERRQIIELPPLNVEVTEHQGEIKTCPACGKQSRASFPENVGAVVAYGPRFQAVSVYLLHHHLLPYARTAALMADLFAQPVSQGTLVGFQNRCSTRLAPVEAHIHAMLRQAPVAHFDETGVDCEKKLYWMHSISTPSLTAYAIDPKRGTEAMERIGILPHFTGRAIHDSWAPYLAYTACRHGLCNVHHLRELTFIAEQEREPWAAPMKECLMAIHRAVDCVKKQGRHHLTPQVKQRFYAVYQSIVNQGFRFHRRLDPLPSPSGPGKKKRGRKKQRPGKNLLDRLKLHQSEILAFMDDFDVPFSNNLAEQDIRMTKVKQKISGCFRSLNGAQSFCRIRSYLSTARKQGWHILSALEAAVQGFPLLPRPLLSG